MNDKDIFSVRMRVIIVIICTALFISFCGAGISWYVMQSSLTETLRSDLAVIGAIADRLVSREKELLKANTQTAANYLIYREGVTLEEALEEQINLHGNMLSLTVYDQSGIVATTGLAAMPDSLISDQSVRLAFGGQPAFSSTMVDSNGLQVFHVSVPMREQILVATIPGMYFNDVLSQFDILKTGYVFLVNAQGDMMANINKSWVTNSFNALNAAVTQPEYAGLATIVSEMIRGLTGFGKYTLNDSSYYCAYLPVTGSVVGWSLGVAAPVAETPVGTARQGFLIMLALLSVFSLLAALIASRPIVRPMILLNNQSLLLADLKAEAESASTAKTDFLAKMSHEIRTPLNTIIGFSELSLNSEKEGQRDNVERIHRAGLMLLSLIDDILDISKIEAGKLELILGEFETPSFIHDVMILNINRIGKKSIDFRLKVDENFPAKLYGDEKRLKQIFNNLLSNAFKYTSQGVVEWSLSCYATRKGWLLVSTVTDTGMGIRPQDMPKLFQIYCQLDTKRNYSTEGTGLGLTITKQLTEMMGGTIQVTSNYGEGSTFTVSVEQGFVSHETIGPQAVQNLRNFRYTDEKRLRNQKLERQFTPARVLVVDDVQANLDLVRELLLPYGMTVDCVTSALKAIELIREEKVHYQAIFMDHMMPEIDGIEATRIIREEIATDYARNIPVLALTANAVGGMKEIFMQSGFQDYLTKPIDIQKLDAAVKRWISDKLPKNLTTSVNEETNDSCHNQDLSFNCIDFTRLSSRGVDVDSAIARLGNDQGIFHSALCSFAQHTPSLIEQLREPSPTTLSDYAVIAHGIKGSSRNIGATALGDLAAAMEAAAKKGDFLTIDRNNDAFITAITELVGHIREVIPKEPSKTQRPTPAPESIREMLDASKEFNITVMEQIMEDLDRYSYQDGQETIDWLKTELALMNFQGITEKLTIEEANRN